ncbi:MAG: response regulator [Candidatus Omnitrophica bacterium]|nr:response regulator [Candidatus Omnitrophota bacterium]
MEKCAILVVDDEAPIRATLIKFLKSLGAQEILEASNGQEAVDKVREAPHIKLILMDLKMPVKDGLKALEEIKAIQPQVKIAILTGYPFYGEADQAVKKWGVLDFIVKPVDLDYLERIVSVALSKEQNPPK